MSDDKKAEEEAARLLGLGPLGPSAHPLDAAGRPILPQQNSNAQVEDFLPPPMGEDLAKSEGVSILRKAASDLYRTASASGALERLLDQIYAKRDLRSDITKAVEAHEQRVETKAVSKESSTVRKAQPDSGGERSFNVALAAYGAMFGTGLLQLAAHDWYFGPIFTVGGGLGLMSIHPLIRPKLQIMRSNRSLWAVITVTWLFLAANLGLALYSRTPAPPVATGRVWGTLTPDEKTLLTLAIKVLPRRDHVRIICVTTDCRDLAADLMGVFHDAGWNPNFLGNSAFVAEPYSLVLYQKDINDHSLNDVIEKTTKLRVDHIEATTDPTVESIFLGIRP